MLENLKENWTKINEEFLAKKKYYYLTPVNYRALRSRQLSNPQSLPDHVRGLVLDLGAGKLKAKPLLDPFSKHYIALDRYPEHPELDIIGDAEKLPFKDNSVDTVYSNSVFEHLRRPWKAAGEISRILSKNGKLILMVPFGYYIHGEPHDYFRFTGHGLRSILEDAGLDILTITPSSGFIGLIASLPMTFIFSLLYKFKPLFWFYYYINKFLVIIISGVDDLFGNLQKKIMPLGYRVIAEKTDDVGENL